MVGRNWKPIAVVALAVGVSAGLTSVLIERLFPSVKDDPFLRAATRGGCLGVPLSIGLLYLYMKDNRNRKK